MAKAINFSVYVLQYVNKFIHFEFQCIIFSNNSNALTFILQQTSKLNYGPI